MSNVKYIIWKYMFSVTIYLCHLLGVPWRIITGSKFDDRIYWHFFTITVDYNSSHIELPLNDVCLATVRGLRPDFYYCQTVGCLLMWGSLSLMRGRVCSLQLLLALASAVTLGSESRGTRDHNLLSQIRDFPFRRLLRLAGLRWRYSTPFISIHESTAFITSTRPA
jgi:hypothetical protein